MAAAMRIFRDLGDFARVRGCVDSDALAVAGDHSAGCGRRVGRVHGWHAIRAWSAGRAVLQRLPPVVAFAGLELWVGVYALVAPLLLDGVYRLDPRAQLVMA